MKRRIFYSFHFKNDYWRTAQVRNIGSLEGNSLISDNDWEKVKKRGDSAIDSWIDDQLKGRSCTIVLVGEETHKRKWVKREIEKSWEAGMGVLGIRIHNLKDNKGYKGKLGKSPFAGIKVRGGSLYKAVKLINPPSDGSKRVYSYISKNLNQWVDEAIEIRKNHGKKSFWEQLFSW